MSTDFRTKSEETLAQRLAELKKLLAELKERPARLKRRPSPSKLRELESQQAIHELHVHQIELEMQNRQLLETQVELELSRDAYADLYDFAPIGYMELSDHGIVLNINLTGAEILGAPRGTVIGKPFSMYLHGENQLRFSERLAACASANDPNARQTLELELRRKTGGMIPVELTMIRIGISENREPICRTTLSDISERKRIEAEKTGLLGREKAARVEAEATMGLLRQNEESLEKRVEERTSALAQAISSLRSEVGERKEAQEACQALFHQLATAQENERRRISRELHDQMGQHLTALSIGLKNLKPSLRDESGTKQLHDLQKLTDEIGQEIHRISFELRPAALDDIGLVPMLANHLEDWSTRFGVKVDFHGGPAMKQRLPSDVETTAYRIVQEALTNVLKHAQATHLSVILSQEGDHLSMVIEDDGKGFDPKRLDANSRQGLGLAGMRERVTLAGGTFQVESSPGRGTSLFARLPLPNGVQKKNGAKK